MLRARKPLSPEAVAWRKLAAWYATNDGWICWNTATWAGIHEWYDTPMPFRAPWRLMHARVYAHGEMGAIFGDIVTPAGLAPPYDKNCNARVIFCSLMALECEEEASNATS